MELAPTRIRQNYFAILVAAVACFLVQIAWYTYFLQAWLAGNGHTNAWLTQSGINPALQYAASLLAEAVMAAAISWIIQATGPQTIFRGITTACLAWIGFVVPALALNHVLEVRTWSLFGINTGFWLAGMIVMGAIVGGWKKR